MKGTSIGKPKRKWEDNIRTGLRETGSEAVDLTDWLMLMDVWWTFMNTVMNFQVLLKAKNF
jgi:hypothetical protein